MTFLEQANRIKAQQDMGATLIGYCVNVRSTIKSAALNMSVTVGDFNRLMGDSYGFLRVLGKTAGAA